MADNIRFVPEPPSKTWAVGLPAFVTLTHPEKGSSRWRVTIGLDLAELEGAIGEAEEWPDTAVHLEDAERAALAYWVERKKILTEDERLVQDSWWFAPEDHQHVDYPHEPGRLHDCPACMDRCHCIPGTTECVFEGEHKALECPKGITSADHWTCRSRPHMCRHYMADMHSYSPRGSYEDACEMAADQSGVQRIVEAWRAAGLDAFADQTGGMTMVATIHGQTGVITAVDDGGFILGWEDNKSAEEGMQNTRYWVFESLEEHTAMARLLADADALMGSMLRMNGDTIELDAWEEARRFISGLLVPLDNLQEA